MVCAACGSFGSDSAGADGGGGDAAGGDAGGGDAAGGDAGASVATCPAETCADAGPTCFFDDFATSCRKEISFNSGDIGAPGVVGECKDGKLHVAMIDTLDMTAHLAVDTPDVYDSIRVSTSLAVARWDLGPVLKLTLDGAPVGELDFAVVKTGPSFTLCGVGPADCAPTAFGPTAGEAHRFTFDITSTTVSLSVDCKPLATRNVAVKLVPRATVGVDFGKVDGVAVDGTLDDLSVSFP
jgi:hypothetical protein